jgi:protein SCO1/2
LIYFGFTNCPDICPEELDKMGQAVEMVDAARKERVLPMFISVDPARDGVKEVKKYIMGESPLTFGYGNEEFGDMTNVRLPP